MKKPIEGVREDGAKGLFKGMGVGLVGVVTRPVSGALDAVHDAMAGIQESVCILFYILLNLVLKHQNNIFKDFENFFTDIANK